MKKMLWAVALIALIASWPSRAEAQCGVFKTWALNEILTSADLNGGFQRAVTANVATCAVGFSSTVSQMRVNTNPYPGSTESLASTVADEFSRIRFQLNALVGKSFWYQPMDNSVAKDVSKHWGATFTKYTEIADPATPATNKELALYAKNDGAGNTVLAYKTSNGNVTVLTGPSTSYGSSLTSNLRIIRNPSNPNTKLDLTADLVSVQNFIATAFSSTIDTGTTGADALDSGTLAANKLYYVWIIYKPSTNVFSGLASLSETAPALPSGYTKQRLITAFSTDASTFFRDGYQLNDKFYFTHPIQAVTGASSVTAVPLDLSLFIPNQSSRAVYVILQPGPSLFVQMHWISFTLSVAPAAAPVTCGDNTAATGTSCGSLVLPTMNTPRSTVYYAVSAGAANIFVTGFEVQWKE